MLCVAGAVGEGPREGRQVTSLQRRVGEVALDLKASTSEKPQKASESQTRRELLILVVSSETLKRPQEGPRRQLMRGRPRAHPKTIAPVGHTSALAGSLLSAVSCCVSSSAPNFIPSRSCAIPLVNSSSEPESRHRPGVGETDRSERRETLEDGGGHTWLHATEESPSHSRSRAPLL